MSNLRKYRGQEYETQFKVIGNLRDLGGSPIFTNLEAHELAAHALAFVEHCSSAIDDIHHRGVKNWEIRDLELLSDFATNMTNDNINLKGFQIQLIAVKTRGKRLICEIELYNKQLHALNLLRDSGYPSEFNDIKMNHFGI